jgi:hypothetical protein
VAQWHVAAASVIGTGHRRRQEPCQDFSCWLRVGDRLICAVSDGAGTARHAEVGARLTATAFVRHFGEVTDLATIDRQHIAGFLGSLRQQLLQHSSEHDAGIDDYACTLLGVIASPTDTVCIQIGDGAIMVPAAEPDSYDWVFWPQHGEYANTTNFVTQANAAEVCELRIGPAVGEFALFSDGLERLILHEATRRVHAPALLPVFQWLRTKPPGEDAGPALAAWLDGEQVNARTDDDKSLVIATLASD